MKTVFQIMLAFGFVLLAIVVLWVVPSLALMSDRPLTEAIWRWCFAQRAIQVVPGIVYPVAGVAFAILGYVGRRECERRKRREERRCLHCGYDLRGHYGSSAIRCSECGAINDVSE